MKLPRNKDDPCLGAARDSRLLYGTTRVPSLGDSWEASSLPMANKG